MTTDTLKYTNVSTELSLKRAVARCMKQGPTALDFETTSLSPADGRVRLVSLCNNKCHYLVDFDKIEGGFRRMAKYFKGGDWVCFNAGFENRWFLDAGTRVDCMDVGNLRRAILGGGAYSLKQLLLWDLDYTMDKEEQASDWGADKLTKSQLTYAYGDAHWTWKLWRYWADQADEGRWVGFRMLNDMVPAVIEMEDAGMAFDPVYHATLVEAWEKVKAEKIEAIRGMIPVDEVANINSDSQWSDYFARNMPDSFLAGWPRTEKTGQLSMKNETLKRLAGAVAATGKNNMLVSFFDALAGYKTITKYLSSFGQTLITKWEMSDDQKSKRRVRARFNIGAAKTCRFSCSGPNLQQIPRDRELLGEATSVRRSFVAGMGRRLVSLDYSGIELRVLALLSGDEQLLQDMVEGDVHAEVAAVIAGHKIDKKTKKGKEARQAAKGVSFGIIYGSAATGLSTTMRCTIGTAQGYIDFWENRYPDAFKLRYDMMDEVAKTRSIRMIDGGTIYMGKRPDMPKCANYPVQRAALAIMARAIVRHKNSLDIERAKGKQRMTRMISTIHDALIDEAAVKDTKRCLALMENDMIQGYLDMFPGAPTTNLVEGGIGPNWAELD
jgi:DNA polymerase-1